MKAEIIDKVAGRNNETLFFIPYLQVSKCLMWPVHITDQGEVDFDQYYDIVTNNWCWYWGIHTDERVCRHKWCTELRSVLFTAKGNALNEALDDKIVVTERILNIFNDGIMMIETKMLNKRKIADENLALKKLCTTNKHGVLYLESLKFKKSESKIQVCNGVSLDLIEVDGIKVLQAVLNEDMDEIANENKMSIVNVHTKDPYTIFLQTPVEVALSCIASNNSIILSKVHFNKIDSRQIVGELILEDASNFQTVSPDYYMCNLNQINAVYSKSYDDVLKWLSASGISILYSEKNWNQLICYENNMTCAQVKEKMENILSSFKYFSERYCIKECEEYEYYGERMLRYDVYNSYANSASCKLLMMPHFNTVAIMIHFLRSCREKFIKISHSDSFYLTTEEEVYDEFACSIVDAKMIVDNFLHKNLLRMHLEGSYLSIKAIVKEINEHSFEIYQKESILNYGCQ